MLLRLSPLALLLLAGCPPSIIDLSYDPPATSSGSTSATGGAGGGTSNTGGAGGASLCMSGAVQPCYDGPAGTEGQGICKPGTRACAADGASWGPCVGEVLPQVENCATPEDDDCDGKAPPCTGLPLWSKSFGDTSGQSKSNAAFGVTADKLGNVVITGPLQGTLNFGTGPLAGAGNYDVFLAKFDPGGAPIWSKRFGDAQGQVGMAVAVDAGENIVLAGAFSGSLDFGGGPLTSAGGDDVFLAKFDSAGSHLWSKRFGDAQPKEQAGYCVTTDGGGNVVVAGVFSGTVDFGTGPVASSSSKDFFVAKFDPSGGPLWSKHFANAGGSGLVNCVATSGAGDVLATGIFSGVSDLGGGPIASSGSQDAFVVKLDSAGGYVWARHLGAAVGSVENASLVVDTAGRAILGGTFVGQIDLGAGPLVGAGGQDIFLTTLDATGAHVWSKVFGDAAGDQWGAAVATDGGGAALLTGYFSETVDFGGGQFVSAGSEDGFVAKFAPDGTHIWSRRFGDGEFQGAYCVSADSTDNVLVTGTIKGQVDFGNGPLMASGSQDIFLAKFAP